MECPRCNVEMTPLEGEDISLQRCAECSGIFTTPDDINRILLRASLPVLDRLDGRANLEEISVECPECSVDLTVIEGQAKNGLRFDTCEGCAGIWLDLKDPEDDEDFKKIEEAIVEHFREFQG